MFDGGYELWCATITITLLWWCLWRIAVTAVSIYRREHANHRQGKARH